MTTVLAWIAVVVACVVIVGTLLYFYTDVIVRIAAKALGFHYGDEP